jgi:molybdopterin/thiamine biosynthesis adenylyltransferase/proteasome lid subunit RPN8/RPN11
MEGAAYLLCGLSRTEQEVRLLARQIVPVSDAHYLVRAHNRLSIDSLSYASIAKRARTEGLSVVFAHCHPRGPASFSEQDDREDPKLQGFFSAMAPEMPHGSLVIAPGIQMKGRVWTASGWEPIERIRVLGNRFQFIESHSGKDQIAPVFERQVLAFGPDIQRLLGRLHIGVVGAGGTGSAVAEQLVRLGVGVVSIFDGDFFEPSNANRVYGSEVSDQGRNKADILADHLRRIGIGGIVNRRPRHITEQRSAKHLRDCDIVFSCVDRHAPRGILARLALRYLIPVFDTAVKIDSENGVIKGIYGRVTTLMAGEACLFCRGRISPTVIALESLSPAAWRALADEQYAPELETENPAVITFTTSVASQAVSEMLHRLTGYMGEERRSSEVLMMFHENEIRRNRAEPDPNCVCMQGGLWGQGDSRDFVGLVWKETSGV